MKSRLLITTLLLALTACASSPDNRYYILTPTPEAQTALDQSHAAPAPDLSVSAPAYLDRPQIVFEDSDGKLDIHTFDRWAEPLDGMIRRVLAEDMQPYPVSPQRSAKMVIDTFKFGENDVTLKAHWTVTQASSNPNKPAVTTNHDFAQNAPAAGDIAADITAMNGLLGELAQQTAATFR